MASLTALAVESGSCSRESTGVGAINFHESSWSLSPFPLSPPFLLLEDNEGDGELCNATNTPLLDRCIRFWLWY